MSTENRFADKISNEETAELPAVEFHGKTVIVDQERDIAAACKYLMEQPVVGFDTETRPSFRPGIAYRVSLLQLSSPERCYLFRLNKIPLAKPILQLLEAPEVKKVGAAVDGDLRALRQIRHFDARSFVDLQSIAPEWGIEEKSLRKLSAIVLGMRVSKAQRLSNWEATTLTDKQCVYAATDAWVCTRIYEILERTPRVERPAPPAAPAADTEATPKRPRRRYARHRRRGKKPAPVNNEQA